MIHGFSCLITKLYINSEVFQVSSAWVLSYLGHPDNLKSFIDFLEASTSLRVLASVTTKKSVNTLDFESLWISLTSY